MHCTAAATCYLYLDVEQPFSLEVIPPDGFAANVQGMLNCQHFRIYFNLYKARYSCLGRLS